jgi:hypothetical protein
MQDVVHSIHRDKQSWEINTVRVWIVRQELSSNFVWIFKIFKLAMGDIALKKIITDQDTGMKAAIDVGSMMQTTKTADGTSCKMQQKG